MFCSFNFKLCPQQIVHPSNAPKEHTYLVGLKIAPLNCKTFRNTKKAYLVGLEVILHKYWPICLEVDCRVWNFFQRNRRRVVAKGIFLGFVAGTGPSEMRGFAERTNLSLPLPHFFSNMIANLILSKAYLLNFDVDIMNLSWIPGK